MKAIIQHFCVIGSQVLEQFFVVSFDWLKVKNDVSNWF